MEFEAHSLADSSLLTLQLSLFCFSVSLISHLCVFPIHLLEQTNQRAFAFAPKGSA